METQAEKEADFWRGYERIMRKPSAPTVVIPYKPQPSPTDHSQRAVPDMPDYYGGTMLFRELRA